MHAKHIDANNNLVKEWENNQRDNLRHHVLLAFVIFAPMLVSELCTSVFSVEKTWFGWDSYCVTPWAFIIRCLAMAVLCLVAATPFSILLYYSDISQKPPVTLNAQDGRFGVGKYADFLSTWAMLLILVPSLLGLIGLRWVMEAEPEFNTVRLLIGSGVAFLIVCTVYRMLRNAIVLRIKITEKLPDILDSHKPQNDPTVQLIGTSWWKLPATLVASLGSVGALLELSGLLEYIAKLVE